MTRRLRPALRYGAAIGASVGQGPLPALTSSYLRAMVDRPRVRFLPWRPLVVHSRLPVPPHQLLALSLTKSRTTSDSTPATRRGAYFRLTLRFGLGRMLDKHRQALPGPPWCAKPPETPSWRLSYV